MEVLTEVGNGEGPVCRTSLLCSASDLGLRKLLCKKLNNNCISQLV